MILVEQNVLPLWVVLSLLALITFGGWWWMYRAGWSHRPTLAEVGHVPHGTFRVGLRTANFGWSLPLARVSTYDGFVVVAALGATPIVLHRSDRVRVHKTKAFGPFDVAVIDLQPARRPGFLLRITPRHRDTISLESALHYSLDPSSARSS